MKISEHQIRDFNSYINRMQKSVLDKMFFIDKVFDPFSNIVDFGCANGELIRALQALFGEYRYVGYDINAEMLSVAHENVPTAEFYSNWNEMKVNFTDSLLNISSTLHEVYSYSSQKEIEEFWQRVFESGFKYVAIRDMMLSDTEQMDTDAEQYNLVVKNEKYADKLKDYEITYLNHFTLPYTAWQIENDFGIELTTPTHIKLIFRRKD